MTRTIAIAALLAAIAVPAAAQPAAEFYRGKTVNMYIGTGESAGAVGAYPRTIAQFIGKHIPGNPTFVVRNMPGAGGIVLANFIDSVGPQDGTAWAFITRGFVLAPLLNRPQAKFDPTRFQWIGSPARTVSVGSVWAANTDVRTLQDAMAKEVIVGATTLAQDTGVFPTLLNQLIGTRFKIVSGYKSVGEVDIAMERGEVHGKVGTTWASLNAGRSAEWVKTGRIRVIVQLGLAQAADIPAEVPLALDFARTPEDRQLMQLIASPSETGFPSFMGPGVPADRVTLIRAAYVQTMNDPEFKAALEKQNLELDPIPAEEIARVVRQLYALPETVKQRARTLLPNE